MKKDNLKHEKYLILPLKKKLKGINITPSFLYFSSSILINKSFFFKKNINLFFFFKNQKKNEDCFQNS